MTVITEHRKDVATIDADVALLALIGDLKVRGYRFVPPTPATHARVVARPLMRAGRGLRDLLGWSLPLDSDSVDRSALQLLESAGMLENHGDLVRSLLRVASLDEDLYIHSAFPTTATDAVFFGPDSYRFAALIRDELGAAELPRCARIVDMGTGAGVGAIVAAKVYPNSQIFMTDINPTALRYAAVNARAAGIDAIGVLSNDLSAIDGPIDAILANPPYIMDSAGRDYRDGGDMHGAEVALDMARAALARLSPGGRLILYTGSAIIEGADPLQAELGALAHQANCKLLYRELDPDVFGEEMSRPAYADVDRIAVVAAIVHRPETAW